MKTNNKGFTLIELILSIAIIAIAFVAFYSLLSSSVSISAKNTETTEMTIVAQGLMENSLAMSFSSLAGEVGSGQTDLTSAIQSQYRSKYTAVRECSYVSDNNDLVKVVIKVKKANWPAYDSKSIIFTSYKSGVSY